MTDTLARTLLTVMEESDRAPDKIRLRTLKQSYDFFCAAGMAEAAVSQLMGLTAHQLRMIRNLR